MTHDNNNSTMLKLKIGTVSAHDFVKEDSKTGTRRK